MITVALHLMRFVYVDEEWTEEVDYDADALFPAVPRQDEKIYRGGMTYRVARVEYVMGTDEAAVKVEARREI